MKERENERNQDDKYFIVSIDTSKTDQRSISTFSIKLMFLDVLFQGMNTRQKKEDSCSELFIEKDYVHEKKND